MDNHETTVSDAESRICKEYEQYTGKSEIKVSVEPLRPGWGGLSASPKVKGYQFTFTQKNLEFEIMALDLNDNSVSDLYGRPTQVFRHERNKPLLKDLAFLARQADQYLTRP